MARRRWVLALLLLGAGAWSGLALGQTPAPQAAPPVAAQEAQRWPADAQSRRAITVGGRQLNYTATAGTLPLAGAKGEPTASIFYVAYTLQGTFPERPVSFVFNGGPGAASAFLHLGAMGPRVVTFKADGSAPVQPVELADNPDAWLDATDLVFVDPVATGYSRSIAGTDEADRGFFGIDKDADALADFVRIYLARAGRALAPVALVGESYGGFRSVLIAERLLRAGIAVRGLVLVSPALEFSMLRANPYSLLPLALVLPSLAAAHIELRDGLDAPLEAVREAEAFARAGYLVHLVSGARADREIDRMLARFTGLPAETIARHHSRVSARTFTREYRKRTDRALSHYDAAVSAPLPRGSQSHFDPILEGAVTVLAPAMTQYARGELGYRTDLEYRLLNRSVSGNWDFGTSASRQGFAGSLDALQQARTHNPALRVLIVHGYTDLVTPYAVSRYLVDQLAPIDTAAPIELKVHRGGHMLYLRPASRRALAEDARAFYRQVAMPR
jgi:carboxypeptidase C (cathepsin A)